MSAPMTDPIRVLREVTFAKYRHLGLGDLGYYNRRKIAGTNIWSQHAWGNAQDLGGSTWLLDNVATWLRANKTQLNIRTILWRVRDHYDHIHVDCNPKQTGTPPLWNEEDEVQEYIKAVQRSLNAAGFRDTTGAPLKVDGQLGPKTEAAMAARDAAAASGEPLPTEFIVEGGRLKLKEA